MDVARLNELRDFIASLKPDKFDMKTFGPLDPAALQHKCGTAACIGGWTIALFEPTVVKATNEEQFYLARDALDLTSEEANALFLGEYAPYDLRELTKADALHALDTMIDTGEPQWPAPF